MKKRFIIVFFLMTFSIVLSAQERKPKEGEQKFSDRNAIPEWVKNKTTPEEYQLWKTFGQYYQIDYSGLKSRKLEGERKEHFYNRLRKMCENLRSGKEIPPHDAKFSIIYALCDTVSAYCTERLECIQKKSVIYTSLDGYDAHVELNLIYYIDEKTKTPQIINCSTQGVSFSGLKVSTKEAKFSGDNQMYGFRINYLSEDKMFKGYYTGTLYFTDAIGKSYQEEVSVNFLIEP